jgi:hypothetical protein
VKPDEYYYKELTDIHGCEDKSCPYCEAKNSCDKSKDVDYKFTKPRCIFSPSKEAVCLEIVMNRLYL